MYRLYISCYLINFWLISINIYFVSATSIPTRSQLPDLLKPILQNTNLSQISDIIHSTNQRLNSTNQQLNSTDRQLNSTDQQFNSTNQQLNSTNQLLNGSRRILLGAEVNHGMPFMVYLKLPAKKAFTIWICAGVIISDDYILTSAACIDDVNNFYIVSGTSTFDPEDDKHTNMCIKNGARKAIWKCVPKNFAVDVTGEDDSIRWMTNDLAVVKVDEEFNFNQRVKGCDYIPRPICYNNRSTEYEKPGGTATIAGWGSTDKYSEKFPSRRDLSYNPILLKTKVTIINKLRCKAFWGPRYERIIENYMICSADHTPHMSEACDQRYVDCEALDMHEADVQRRRLNSANETNVINRSELKLFSYRNNSAARRRSFQNSGSSRPIDTGGFCENDHGGPMVWGEGPGSVLIGVVSACLVKEQSNKCKGPFLFTSVYKNRKLVDCAIYKDLADCARTMRASEIEESHMSWIDHPDGPAKNEIGPQLEAEYRKVFSTEPSNIHQRSTDIPPATAKEIRVPEPQEEFEE